MQHILIVEDEAAIADTLLFALQGEGFRTSWVSLAGDALALHAREPADLWILDVGLPDERFRGVQAVAAQQRGAGVVPHRAQ